MKYFIPFVFLLLSGTISAQTPGDTTVSKPRTVQKIKTRPVKKDTVRIIANDTASAAGLDIEAVLRTNGPVNYRAVLKINSYYNFFSSPESRFSPEHIDRGKDALFYLLAGLLLFFALIKSLFSKYVNNLIGLMFRGSLRQKQIREQLLQTPLPSLLLNIFFVIVGGLYIFFLIRYYNYAAHTAFWLQLIYCILIVGLVYLVKFVILKLTGWIFNMRDAADTYIFIVFLVNKLLAIFLLPLLIMMVFSMASWTGVLLTLSYVMLGMFFAYRYIVSFAPVRREVKVSQFHFFMYLCAFEIIPLLLMYKILLHFFS